MKTFHACCVIAGLLLLSALIWTVGPDRLWHDMLKLGWGLIPLIAIELAAQVFHTLGWRHCLAGPLRYMPFSRIFCIRMAGLAVNHITPTADMGGEVTRGTLLSLYHPGPQAASGVIVGKLAYTLAQVLFIGCGSVIVLWGIRLPAGVSTALVAGGCLLCCGVAGFLLVQKYGKLGTVVRWLAARSIGGRFTRSAALEVTKVDNDLRSFYRENPGGLVRSVCWHVVGLACGIVQSVFFFMLLTGDYSLPVAAGAWFLGGWLDLLCFVIPSNIGVLEGTRVLAFRILQLPSSLGLSYGVALRLEQLSIAVIGLVMYGCFMLPYFKKKAAAAE